MADTVESVGITVVDSTDVDSADIVDSSIVLAPVNPAPVNPTMQQTEAWQLMLLCIIRLANRLKPSRRNP